MTAKTGGLAAAVFAMLLVGALPAWAQAPAPTPAPAEEKKAEEEKPKTLWDEFKLFSYIEMGATFSLHGGSVGVPGSTSSGDTNLLRQYDLSQGYTFNMAEFSIKRDPDEKFPFGEGLVLTAGEDARKNHSIGLLRSETDVFPFRNDPWFDLQEAYISARIPIGEGPVIKVGKFVTLHGYEVIESPNNLNYSRSFLFTLAIPLTHTGIMASYSFTDWLSVQGGLVLGWDRSNLKNDGPSGHGQIAVTPIKDLPIALSFIVGPEKSGDKNPVRGLVDLTATYTGIKDLTLGFNFDYGAQQNDAFLTSQGLGDKSSKWYGLAGYIAYDFLKDFRASLRQEWFQDADGTRTATVGGVALLSTTATLQYNIWKGLYARGEYRHDSADEKVFGCRPNANCDNKSQDTLSLSLYYKFF
jgi:Putative beta-barrel porin-2, OmpL-like. bbp2